RTMNAADIGHEHIFAKRRKVDDVVDPRAERLDPFQFWRVADDMIGHRWRKAEENVGVGDIGSDVIVVADHIDGQLRKPCQKHRLVAGAHRFLDFRENKYVGHGRWYSVIPKCWNLVFQSDFFGAAHSHGGDPHRGSALNSGALVGTFHADRS